ncbi:ParB N-terminal domain-containing protein [Streptomyces sp. NPDC005407]|uniref:ParB N-terminal domain-containing protein n=1 Tax=Streptomyces sp. NPDC005407 TaxID=3155340 RepID=UPI0033B29D20
MASLIEKVERVPVDSLTLHPQNARRGDVKAIAASLRANAQFSPIVVQASTHYVLSGNHTLMAARELGWQEIDAVIIDVDDDRAHRIMLAANRTADIGTYDNDALAELLSYMDGDYEGTGYTDADVQALINPPDFDGDPGTGGQAGDAETPSLADRFLIPPFDVLDARQGWWRTRKQQWLSLGMRSEIGRDGNLVFQGWAQADPRYYDKKKEVEQRIGRGITVAEFEADHYTPPDTSVGAGTSVFDPVLCELAYRWFSPAGGTVVDPFAGGSVRGLVAAILGRPYRGNDLSDKQVESNREQRDDFATRRLLAADPAWTIGDSSQWVDTLEPGSADLVFTCPPYYDLEEYSTDPADLSSMAYEEFDQAYARIIDGAARALRPNRYAVFVTGDARDSKGGLHDLRGSTIRAATAAGLTYASGGVLVTPVGSIRVTAARAFTSTRGLARCHQDVLVFCKGSRSEAARACGNIDVHLPDEVDAAFNDAADEEE